MSPEEGAARLAAAPWLQAPELQRMFAGLDGKQRRTRAGGGRRRVSATSADLRA